MWQDWIERSDEIYRLTGQHLEIVFLSVFLAIGIGLPTGICIALNRKSSKWVLSVVNIFQTIPSLALFGIIIPFLGIGKVPAIVVLLLYALLPIIKNTFTGIRAVDNTLIEAGRALGLSQLRVLWRVQLPLAFPVIMSGVRIATVISVGTATIAAYIGAGGLGDLIFRGISLGDNALILAGAIPTAMLAIGIDFAMSGIEHIITPAQNNMEAQRFWKKSYIKYVVLGLFLLAFMYPLIPSPKKKSITVGHKHFTEQRILGELLSEYIQQQEGKSTEVVELGGSKLNFEALKSGEIDLYVEYTGTAFQSLLGHSGKFPSNVVFDSVKNELLHQFGIEVAAGLGFNNTYTLSVLPGTSQKYGLQYISDLLPHEDSLILGSSSEFVDRPDGLPGLKKVYGLDFREVKLLEIGLRYQALVNQRVDVIDAYSTDGRLKKFHLTVLKDDKGFFPPYEAIVLTRPNFEIDYPEAFRALQKLKGTITNEEMQQMNFWVEEKGYTIYEAAASFLDNNFEIE